VASQHKFLFKGGHRANFSALLIVIFVVTLLAPGFGWELAASAGPHTDTAIDWCDTNSLETHASPDKSGSHAPHDHHGCAGHLFGHLTSVSADLAWHLLPDNNRKVARKFGRAYLPMLITRRDRPPATLPPLA